jgi:hypothetical protein
MVTGNKVEMTEVFVYHVQQVVYDATKLSQETKARLLMPNMNYLAIYVVSRLEGDSGL